MTDFAICLRPDEAPDFPPGPVGYDPEEAEAVRQMLRERGFTWCEVSENWAQSGVSLITPFFDCPVEFENIPEFLAKVTVTDGVMLYDGKTAEQLESDLEAAIEKQYPGIFHQTEAKTYDYGDEDQNNLMRLIDEHTDE